MYSKPELKCRAQAKPPYGKAMIIGNFPDPRPFFPRPPEFRIEMKSPRTRSNAAETKTSSYPVQASALQGGEIALGHALGSTCPVDRLWMSPSLRGSNPYPCGSLTYRGDFYFVNIICFRAAFCKLFHKFSAKNSAGRGQKGGGVQKACGWAKKGRPCGRRE